jgi:5-methylcytosine-specific restriction endonuclease McrA
MGTVMGSAVGVLKIAAGRLKITLAEYQEMTAAKQKWCCQCRRWRPLSRFCRDPSRGAGVSAHCRCCKKRPGNFHLMSQRGPRNPNWRGGVTSEYRRDRTSANYEEWRLAVFQRDSFACQHCGDARGRNLNAHHLKDFTNYPSLRFDVTNGITLCRACHARVHDAQPRIRRRVA